MTKKKILGSAPEPYVIEVALGQVEGVTLDTKFGRNPSIGTSFSNINNLGGMYTYTTAETSLYMSSTSTSDTDQTVFVKYMTEALEEVEVEVSLQGQTKTLVCSDFYRLLRAAIVGGSDLVGNVFLYEDDTLSAGEPVTSTKKRGLIDSTTHQTQLAQLTVPINSTDLIFDFLMTSGKDNNMEFQARIRPADGSGPWRVIFDHDIYRSPIQGYQFVPRAIPGGYDIEVLAKGAASTTEASVEWTYIRNTTASDE